MREVSCDELINNFDRYRGKKFVFETGFARNGRHSRVRGTLFKAKPRVMATFNPDQIAMYGSITFNNIEISVDGNFVPSDSFDSFYRVCHPNDNRRIYMSDIVEQSIQREGLKQSLENGVPKDMYAEGMDQHKRNLNEWRRQNQSDTPQPPELTQSDATTQPPQPPESTQSDTTTQTPSQSTFKTLGEYEASEISKEFYPRKGGKRQKTKKRKRSMRKKTLKKKK